ncbi:alpha/beta hydrolase [Bifidobacterium gallicum]|uniref:Esterase family protein n=1 Tax=Bifidobacterium gallicum DSM 20093 = LMG 11596 TaxID=561180 RepID=D1NUQ2_9BIFI|nr:alpha/beta hydrolase-fold protein [Bifidobacterium gallicum]EFA22553.1 hypothetical protein BIFGAL_03578 [Bifidobacterium gallicum DSM 20093 = LMG 11596]KFI59542.1 esterase family protein [Bifidobacterium gallicum DSM 20093 = LMG 11596]
MVAWHAVRIVDGWLPITVYTVCVVLMIVLAVSQLSTQRRGRLGRQIVAALVTGVVAFIAAYVVSDVRMSFGVSLGWYVISSFAVGMAVFGWAVAALISAAGWRKIVAGLLVPVSLLSTAVMINSLYGEYTTLGSVFGYDDDLNFSSVQLSLSHTISVAEWKQQQASGHSQRMPDEGRQYTVEIPATDSGFKARPAIVWLPPAAFAKHPPKLPVMVMLAGNPGSPGRYFGASNTVEVLTKYAEQHGGLAPIVVSPDQNGADDINAMCANTKTHGAAETYLTVDVPRWIRTHLPVQTEASQWTLGGFSQGGTCAVSLGPNHANLFGTLVSVDGELQQTSGSVDKMIREDFGGDHAAYERQVPLNAMRAHAPSHQTLILAAGSQDKDAIQVLDPLAQAAREAGMHVTRIISKDAGHNWKAVNQVFEWALPWIAARQGLSDNPQPISDFPALEVEQ